MCCQMKKSKLLLVVILLFSIIQSIMFYYLEFDALTFAAGFFGESDEIVSQLMSYGVFLLAPLLIIFTFFSGTLKELTEGYGKLVIIRNYSRNKLLAKELIKVMSYVILIVLMQAVVSWSILKEFSVADISFAKSLITYFLALYLLILFEIFLELFSLKQSSVLVLIIYTLISYFLKGSVKKFTLLKIIFFPNLIFCRFDSAVFFDSDFVSSTAILILLTTIMIILNFKKFKEVDIF